MKFKIQVIIEADDGDIELIQEVACLERGTVQSEEVGLTLAEAKVLLQNMQQVVVQQQTTKHLKE